MVYSVNMSREKKLAKKLSRTQGLDTPFNDQVSQDSDWIPSAQEIDTGIFQFDMRPKRVGGMAGRTITSPSALVAQAESKWAQTNGRYNNDIGLVTPFTMPQYGRTAARIVDPKVVKNINSANWEQKGPTGKLAQPQKTKGRSGPVKGR